MGLRDWLAKNVSGVSGYGETMGREAVKNGIAVGRVLYLGHGTSSHHSDVFIYESIDELKAAGYEPYCGNDLQRPPMQDSSKLSIQARACGVAFAVQCCMTAAQNFMQPSNAANFNRSMGAGSKQEFENQRSAVTSDMVLEYLRLPRPDGLSKVLNVDDPGSNDLFGAFLLALSRQGDGRAVAFPKTGVLGFDAVVVPLATETIQSISGAAPKFGW